MCWYWEVGTLVVIRIRGGPEGRALISGLVSL